ncbi:MULTISPECIES: LysR substrate-binding domain-containing protein [unclassified Streptomyces]|uniref:LysR substrate-binding domain-containing protein n=1 Tax=unclassified Streptomyces TaxID=2593676 RepID=UPI003009EA9F
MSVVPQCGNEFVRGEGGGVAPCQTVGHPVQAALAGRPLICLPRGTGLRGTLERACAQAGFSPRIAFEAAAPTLVARLAARGLGVAVVPELPSGTAAAFGLRTLPLTAPGLRGRSLSHGRRTGPPLRRRRPSSPGSGRPSRPSTPQRSTNAGGTALRTERNGAARRAAS